MSAPVEAACSYRVRIRVAGRPHYHYVDVKAANPDEAVRKVMESHKSAPEAVCIGRAP